LEDFVNEAQGRLWEEPKKPATKGAFKKWYHANLERARELGRLNMRKRRAADPEKYRKIGTAQWKKRTDFNRALIADWKRVLHCYGCGESDPVVLDFHHKDPTVKKFRLGIAAYRKSPEQIIEEILKCIALCANCHRREHARQRAKA
jgi:hypothetical protein